ncbi:MAG TPA: SGNH/GDSL hydrolase family protein [Polyangiaceae bacterium]|nr:SGNH/GDSL hydrolase family protein [Polyangiaceae bacterium]
MKTRGRRVRILAYLAALGCAALVLAEIGLRLKGFGDPPLHHLDAKIEYYAKQGSYRRHGNFVQVNAFGMRGEPVRPRGTQLRVLLLGDSIVFGTYRVGQDELISTSLEPELARLSKRDVEVLNVACSSWGPENQLGYLERFGSFDADAVVWVLSSHDAYDVPVPGFAELLPREPRALALGEVYDLYWQKRFKPPPPTGDPLARSLKAVERIVARFRKEGLPLLVVHHWSETELGRGMDEEGLRLDALFDSLDVPVFSLKSVLLSAREKGKNPLQDPLHLSPDGARATGTAIAHELVRRGMHLEKSAGTW